MDNLPRGVNKTALMIYLVVKGENVKGNVSFLIPAFKRSLRKSSVDMSQHILIFGSIMF